MPEHSAQGEGRDEFKAHVAKRTEFWDKDIDAAGEAKLAHGIAKYGPDAWRHHDMLAELLEEIVDQYNYAFLKWRQLREVECTPVIVATMDEMIRVAADAMMKFHIVGRLQESLDIRGVPRSLTGENRVGVQPDFGVKGAAEPWTQEVR